MLFVTTSVAARIERAEAEVARDFGLRARGRGADVLLEPIGGTTAVYGGPGQPFNKLAGLGFGGGLDEADLGALEAKYDARGGEIRVEQATLADPSVAILLTRRGYELIGYENVLGLALTAEVRDALARGCAADAADCLQISRARADETRTWIDTVAEGSLHPDSFDGPPPTETFERETLERVFADFGTTPGVTLYLARRDGAIAGGGSLRVSDGLVQLAGASTLPAHRRRGVQSALLRARLLDAAQAGADLAVVTTEPASKSQQNVQRAGFQLLYARAILVRRARTGA
jgi:ribosomal protein S18 acetylase RimI-like enzyme